MGIFIMPEGYGPSFRELKNKIDCDNISFLNFVGFTSNQQAGNGRLQQRLIQWL
jgi:hypothetical protein